jgi:hypothetical protein
MGCDEEERETAAPGIGMGGIEGWVCVLCGRDGERGSYMWRGGVCWYLGAMAERAGGIRTAEKRAD